ncbi:MAG: YIP1 family protein, partial [Verrucomicrobiota bacterium]
QSAVEGSGGYVAMEKFTGPGMMKVFGSVGAIIGSFVKIFWWGFVIWALARWLFKVEFPYMRAVEAAGLAAMFGVLGAIVSLLLAVTMGSMFATPSLALLVDEFSPANKTHLLLGAVNFFNLWLVGVLAFGLSRLSGISFGKAALVLFCFWTALELAFIFAGAGQMAL